MADKRNLEVKVNALQRDMATIVKVVKELSVTVKKLEDKAEKEVKGEIHDILENQRMVDKIIEENSKAIEKLNKEISKLENQDLKIEASKHEVEKAETKPKDKEKRCRYYNKGYCKYVGKCRYFHANEICQRHLENLKCSERTATRVTQNSANGSKKKLVAGEATVTFSM